MIRSDQVQFMHPTISMVGLEHTSLYSGLFDPCWPCIVYPLGVANNCSTFHLNKHINFNVKIYFEHSCTKTLLSYLISESEELKPYIFSRYSLKIN